MVSTKDIKESIVSFLVQNGYKLKTPISGNTLKVLTEKNRYEELNTILNILSKNNFNTNLVEGKSSISSVGYIVVEDKIRIVVKPINLQGNSSAGIKNELILADAINKLCLDKPVNLRFFTDGNIFEIKNAIHCKVVGRRTTGRRKADIIVETIDNKFIPLSIKKGRGEAVMYESCDNYCGLEAKLLLEKLLKESKVKLTYVKPKNNESHGYNIITPNIAWKPTLKQKEDVLFGCDIRPNGCILMKTFSQNPFVYNKEDDFYECRVDYIFKNASDVNGENEVWFFLRNNSSRNSKKLGYPGLRILAVSEQRINKNVLKIS